jgi:hypothetical protein
LGVEGLRVAYNLSLGMGRKALEALVSAVVLDAEGGWGLADGGTRHSGQLAPGDASADVSVEPTDPST